MNPAIGTHLALSMVKQW